MVMLKDVDAVAIWHIGIYSLIHQSAMGFAIGASSLRLHWAPHGLLWGILFGLFPGVSYGDRRFPSNLLFL
ncbi:hypothetical protein CEE34_09995 [Candidatus Aerophobetes bacterium Ae_b3a]|nr:MAG: hypothetical protein CEE34_09995 [Candidatus Aerophobetes bacterium Ae_b3a]